MSTPLLPAGPDYVFFLIGILAFVYIAILPVLLILILRILSKIYRRLPDVASAADKVEPKTK